MNCAWPTAVEYRHVVFPDLSRNLNGPAEDASGRGFVAPRCGPLEEEENAFLEFLFVSSGLDLSNYKPETLRRRLPACLRALRVTELSDARRLVERSAHRRRHGAERDRDRRH